MTAALLKAEISVWKLCYAWRLFIVKWVLTPIVSLFLGTLCALTTVLQQLRIWITHLNYTYWAAELKGVLNFGQIKPFLTAVLCCGLLVHSSRDISWKQPSNETVSVQLNYSALPSSPRHVLMVEWQIYSVWSNSGTSHQLLDCMLVLILIALTWEPDWFNVASSAAGDSQSCSHFAGIALFVFL